MLALRRRLFILASAVSLAVCVTVLVLWVRSYAVVDQFTHAHSGPDKGAGTVFGFGLCRGRIYIVHTLTHVSSWPQDEGWRHASDTEPRRYEGTFEELLAKFGCKWPHAPLFSARGSMVGLDDTRITRLSLWPAAILLALLPLLTLRRWVTRRRRARAGRCPECGFDLRATPERCPECGTIPEKRRSISD